MKQPVIVWFRQDLRLADNPALQAAAKTGAPLLPVYILDDENAGEHSMGAASRWWLHHSLESLNRSLGGRLLRLRGDAAKLIPDLLSRVSANAVYWNRCYEPWRIERDKRIKAMLQGDGLVVRSFNGSLLFEPPQVSKQDGTPYRVFTPFYRKGCLQGAPAPRQPLPPPAKLNLVDIPLIESAALDLLPDTNWYSDIAASWSPGEQGASERLQHFLKTGLDGYKDGRNRPDQSHVSRLSPHIHFGEVSPNQTWFAAQQSKDAPEQDLDCFLSELGWREFSHNLLYNTPELPSKNLQRKFDRFPWRRDDDALRRWQQGLTGYPIVDAAMRELWRTGYMHNRPRMIVGSFLVKNLLLDWRLGEAWFWDTLLDADLANNSAGWQWIAGCGADAAPYFRIFNPVTQGKKFDPEGTYVRRYVPELAPLPDKFLHNPWEAPAEVLADAGITLGSDYPRPIVDLKESRERALQAFRQLSEAA